MKETIFSKGEGWRLAALLNINSLKGFFKKLVKEMFKWKVKLNNLHITLQKYIKSCREKIVTIINISESNDSELKNQILK